MHNIAKIRLNEKEKEELEQYKKGLLNYFKILDGFDADSANTEIADIKNSVVQELDDLRDDRAGESLHQKDVLKNAPKTKDGFFVI